MTSFTDKYIQNVRSEVLQLDSMNERLKNTLYNFCISTFRVGSHAGPYWYILSEIICDRFGKQSGRYYWSTGHNVSDYFKRDRFSKDYNDFSYDEVYVIIENMMKLLSKPPFLHFINIEEKVNSLNQLLERENSGYRMIDNIGLIPITCREELESVEEALETGKSMVDTHMQKAVELFRDRDNRDYPNTIKEAVSALEALIKNLSNDENGKFGVLIKNYPLHPALQKATDNLYGYASDAGGIRHSKKEGQVSPDFDTAKFVLVTASALINFIVSQEAKSS